MQPGRIRLFMRFITHVLRVCHANLHGQVTNVKNGSYDWFINSKGRLRIQYK